MRTWSLVLAVEAALSAGPHTLAAPVLLLALAAPMPGIGAALLLLLVACAFISLAVYWLLAVATIERRSFRFGPMYWAGAASAFVFTVLVCSLARWEFWAAVLALPLASALHFTVLQNRMALGSRAT